jgi:serine/threonine protein kinase
MRKLSDDFLEFNIFRGKNKHTKELVLIKEISKKIIHSYSAMVCGKKTTGSKLEAEAESASLTLPLNLNSHKKNEFEKIFNKEIYLLSNIKSDLFIKFIDFFETESHYYIVTEYFEGKNLEDFIESRKNLPEILVQKILGKLAPIIKFIDDNEIILEFLSPRSFCFKTFINEDNFEIKLFDYGLNAIFMDNINIKNYILLEDLGKVNNKKTNVISFGMIVYKMLFGNTIYNFSSGKDEKELIKGK